MMQRVCWRVEVHSVSCGSFSIRTCRSPGEGGVTHAQARPTPDTKSHLPQDLGAWHPWGGGELGHRLGHRR